MVLLVEGVAAAGSGALHGTAANRLVAFDAVRVDVGMNARVAVTIHAAMGPGALPTNIVNQNGSLAPANAAELRASFDLAM